MKTENYRGYEIYKGDLYVNFEFAHKDYDGAPDGNDNRCGHGDTIEECRELIDELIEEEND